MAKSPRKPRNQRKNEDKPNKRTRKPNRKANSWDHIADPISLSPEPKLPSGFDGTVHIPSPQLHDPQESVLGDLNEMEHTIESIYDEFQALRHGVYDGEEDNSSYDDDNDEDLDEEVKWDYHPIDYEPAPDEEEHEEKHQAISYAFILKDGTIIKGRRHYYGKNKTILQVILGSNMDIDTGDVEELIIDGTGHEIEID